MARLGERLQRMAAEAMAARRWQQQQQQASAGTDGWEGGQEQAQPDAAVALLRGPRPEVAKQLQTARERRQQEEAQARLRESVFAAEERARTAEARAQQSSAKIAELELRAARMESEAAAMRR